MFKVVVVLMALLLALKIFTDILQLFSIVNFEQVNAGWAIVF